MSAPIAPLHSSPRAATHSRGKIRFSKQPPLLLLSEAFFIERSSSFLLSDFPVLLAKQISMTEWMGWKPAFKHRHTDIEMQKENHVFWSFFILATTLLSLTLWKVRQVIFLSFLKKIRKRGKPILFTCTFAKKSHNHENHHIPFYANLKQKHKLRKSRK